MRKALVIAILATAAGGCGSDAHKTDAVAAFEEFQRGLFAHDKSAVRNVLTYESRQVVEHLPWKSFASQQPLETLGCELVHGQFRIKVRDPNQANRESIYVVVRQDSHYRVDLIASTGFNHTERALPGPAMRYVPKQLTADEIAEITAREASHIR